MSEVVALDGLIFEPFIPKPEIIKYVKEVADKINKQYEGKEIVLICVLKGSFVFINDLIKYLTVPIEIDFIKVSSYHGLQSSGKMETSLDFDAHIKGKHVLIVEDIIDSGLTARYLMERVQQFAPSSARLVTFLFKPDAIKTDLTIDFVGREIPNDFVVGYGMDYNEKGRELPAIFKRIK